MHHIGFAGSQPVNSASNGQDFARQGVFLSGRGRFPDAMLLKP